MRADVFGDARSAIVAARNSGVLANQFGGAPALIKPTGRYYLPHDMMAEVTGTTLATTAARYYVVPFYVDRPTTFAGAWTFNGGAGDNGDKCKIAAYYEAATGGPGTLAKSFGEVTLTGAAAGRTFASSWLAAPGMYYLEFVNDNSVTMYCMTTLGTVTAVGQVGVPVGAGMKGWSTTFVPSSAVRGFAIGEYVGGTYANFPEATSLTPATTVSVFDTFPIFGLYT